MSDPNSSDQTAASAGQPDATHNDALPHLGSPGIVPRIMDAVEAEAEFGRSEPPLRDAADCEPKHAAAGSAATYGTALIITPPRIKAERPEAAAAKVEAAKRFKFGSIAAMAATAMMGGIVGSLATAGIPYFTAPQSSAPPAYYSAFSEALGRVDRQLAVLKSGVDNSTKPSQLVTKLAERVDRTEKAQADAGTKIAKANDAIDRIERRLAAASSDITGSIGEPHAAAGAAAAVGPDAKRPATAPVVDGWVLHDVYNGSAMIQSRSGAAIIQVIPGDYLPGIGRIDQIKRQDGHWVVVTSRGLIVSH